MADGPFSFQISSITNPPTTEPQGSFSFATLDSSSNEVDYSDNHKLTASSPAEIVSPALSLSSYMNSAQATATISLRITSLIEYTDTFFIQVPAEVSLDSLTLITANNIQIAGFSLADNLISFSGISISTSIAFNIVLETITNPPYVTTTAPFSITTKRNNYPIDSISPAFTYTTVSGSISGSLSPKTSSQSGAATDYTLALSTAHSIGHSNKFTIDFPS